MTDPARLWHPVGRSDDAVLRHVHQAMLSGREFAVWRADDGFVNVWDNRCLHRGVRLSVGLNEGLELRCLYHGWRYSNRTGGCTYIPAHPAGAPARSMCNKTFPAVERYGLIWTTEMGDGEPPAFGTLDSGTPFPVRALPFDAAPELVVEELLRYRFDLTSGESNATFDATSTGPFTVEMSARPAPSTDDAETLVVIVAPSDANACAVYGVLAEAPQEPDRLAVLLRHARSMEAFRTRVEAMAALAPRHPRLEPALQVIAPSDSGPPAPRARADADLRVVVARKWEVATGVMAFELASISEPLPTTQPGSHIDVHLPNGLVRQYSLTNRAGDQESYVIGVKLEPESRGGSACLHGTVREGDVLAISSPRPNFPLRRDATHSLLIAGGIGITPLLAMAETLHAGGHHFTLHCFAQSSDHLAFRDRLDRLGEGSVRHLGLTPSETGDRLREILADYGAATHVYICGPGPMLDAARSVASAAGWPDGSVHFEYFKNSTEIDQSGSFEISLARSARDLRVGVGETILDVLRANGISVASSCEQGACGTCVVGLLDGEPLHQDVYLTPTEQAAGDRIATCVSRAVSDRLVLDL